MRLGIFVVFILWFSLSRFLLKGTIVLELIGSKAKCYGA